MEHDAAFTQAWSNTPVMCMFAFDVNMLICVCVFFMYVYLWNMMMRLYRRGRIQL